MAINDEMKPMPISNEMKAMSVCDDLKPLPLASDHKELPVVSPESVSESNTTSVKAVVFWLSIWFTQNISITFLNKKALTGAEGKSLRLPITLTFFHMVCNSIGAYLYTYTFKQIERKHLTDQQKRLLFYFSMVFVSNIVTGNWSLGTVSVSFNQLMRALVPGCTVILSMIILRKEFSTVRKLALIPVAFGVYVACSGDNTYTMFGLIITSAAVCFAALKTVLSSKFLTGDLKLHPVDLILHQAPYSAVWCFIFIFVAKEDIVISTEWEAFSRRLIWFIFTGIMSFTLNISSFFANKVTSALTLAVFANVKQMTVILLSITLSGDYITAQKAMGIVIVILGGMLYSYIGYKESRK